MSSRISLRRKAVLPVTIIRHNGLEKKHAHTLDLTETSARLAGLSSPLEQGEIIEIQRGVLKAKFQVFWMGALGSPVAGQAGVRSVDPNKRIWGVNLAPDETDLAVDAERMRDPFRSRSRFPGEKRRNSRYLCRGGVSIRTASAMFAIHGEGKDISIGGIYVESMHPVAVNTHVTLNLTIEGIGLEARGVVRTSYPLVGMGICFNNVSAHDQERIALIIKRAQQAEAAGTSISSGWPAEDAPEEDSGVPLPLLNLNAYPAPVLASACKMLAAGLDSWKSMRSAEELEQVREAIGILHEKLLLTVPPIELFDYFAAAAPHDRATQ
jgi:hypothetical protein